MPVIARAFLLAALSLAAALPAQAQRGHGEAQLRATSIAYGDCVVRRYTARAQQVVLVELPNDRILDDHRRLISPDCMNDANNRDGSGIRFRADSFRTMLAEGLVRLHYPQSGPTDFSAVPRIDRPAIAPIDEAALARLSARRQAEAREEHRVAIGLRTLNMLSECVVRAVPDEVRALAQTDPHSAAETQGFAPVQPAIAACLPAETNVRLNRAVLRGALLLSYYRLAHAVQPVALPPRD